MLNQIESDVARRYHWAEQRRHWKWLTALAIVALLLNAAPDIIDAVIRLIQALQANKS